MRYSKDDEKASQSKHSPGIVKDAEELLRVIFYPEHVVNGNVIATAISLDDLSDRGFSIDRRTYASRSIIEQRINFQTEKMPEERQESTISKFRCGAVRKLRSEDRRRACIVVDTALPENPAHASIYSAESLGKGSL
jgi:hypothetical protein